MPICFCVVTSLWVTEIQAGMVDFVDFFMIKSDSVLVGLNVTDMF